MADLSHAASTDDKSGSVDGSPVDGAERADVDGCFRPFLSFVTAAAGASLLLFTATPRCGLLEAWLLLSMFETSAAGPLRLSKVGRVSKAVGGGIVVAISREVVMAKERAATEGERREEIVMLGGTIAVGAAISLRRGVSVGAGLLGSGRSSSWKIGERGRSKIEWNIGEGGGMISMPSSPLLCPHNTSSAPISLSASAVFSVTMDGVVDLGWSSMRASLDALGVAEAEMDRADETEVDGTDEPGMDGADEPGMDGVDEPGMDGADGPEVGGEDSPEVDGADEPEVDGVSAGSASMLSMLTSRPSKSNLIIALMSEDNARPRARHSSGAEVGYEYISDTKSNMTYNNNSSKSFQRSVQDMSCIDYARTVQYSFSQLQLSFPNEY